MPFLQVHISDGSDNEARIFNAKFDARITALVGIWAEPRNIDGWIEQH